MSLDAYHWALKQRPPSTLHKLVLMALAWEQQNHPDYFDFGVERIAEMCCTNVVRARRAILDLAWDGFIALQAPEEQGGQPLVRVPSTRHLNA